MSCARSFVVALAALSLLLGGTSVAAAATRPVVSVAGGELVDASGDAIQLRGVNRSGSEYACSSGADPSRPGRGGYAVFDGPTYDSDGDSRGNSAQDEASVDAMLRWGVNAVRIPLSDACWFGNPALNPAYSGSNYQQAITNYVDLLGRKGIVAILSLHVASTDVTANLGLRLLPMPAKVRGPDFWASVVQRLGNALPPAEPGQSQQARRNVIYDAFNEPHLEDVPVGNRWYCWRVGCPVNPADRPDPLTGQPPVPDPTPSYDTAGMATIVAKIRSAESDSGSPTRPIMLGGLDYANDLSEWEAHLPADPKDALVASFHVYGGEATLCADDGCWDDSVAPIRDGASPHPVVTGEVGQYDCRADFLARYTSWADRRTTGDGSGVSYLAWTWNATLKGTPTSPGVSGGWRCDGGPSVLKFNDGTPTDAYGLTYCQHLRARHALFNNGVAAPLLPAGSSNPCPASRIPTNPPVDATPPPVIDPGPDPGPSSPPVAADPVPVVPGPFVPSIVTPTVPGVPVPSVPQAPATPRPVPAAEPRTASVTSRSLRLKGGRVVLAVSCAKGSTPCRGRVKVRTAKRVAVGRRRTVVVLLSAAYSLRAGTSATIRVAPTKDGRAVLRTTRKVAAVATATSDGGLPRVRRLTLTR